ncbi:PhzF family phenazine biosynthesis protein [Acidimangrovimonas pyrenivorans]|uniref:PhzF family phenazine biosynthesis protein n=1 Tax=Acidimangrovimonas pyrenivorans TaxID=2030798 RepID=A0ABV7ACG3_9RHOB
MLAYHTLDVFTTQAFAGNPLAVVLGADSLTPEQMQIIAREFNLSETIFVQRPRNPDHEARVRIFFPTAEIPFAGHPTIGCACLLADLRHGPDNYRTHLVLEEQAGLVPVTVTRKRGVTEAEFIAPVLPYAHPGEAPAELIAAALDLGQEAIGFGRHAPGIWEGGPAFLYVPVADRAALARARPIEPHWSALMAAAKVDSAYLYTRGDGVDFQARMFSPTAGIPEDPATGSATAILAAQLQAAGRVRPGEHAFSLLQGAEMGRPSHLTLTVVATATKLVEVRIRGAAMPVSEGRIAVPGAR